MAKLTKGQAKEQLDKLFERAANLSVKPIKSVQAKYFKLTGLQVAELEAALDNDPNWMFDETAFKAGRGSVLMAYTQITATSPLVAPTKVSFSIKDGDRKLVVMGNEMPEGISMDAWQSHLIAEVKRDKRTKKAHDKRAAGNAKAEAELYATI